MRIFGAEALSPTQAHGLVISNPILAEIIKEWISVTTMKTATPGSLVERSCTNFAEMNTHYHE